jgi:hypothetical protein
LFFRDALTDVVLERYQRVIPALRLRSRQRDWRIVNPQLAPDLLDQSQDSEWGFDSLGHVASFVSGRSPSHPQ